MSQSRKHSALEAVLNVGSGMLLAFVISQLAAHNEQFIQTWIWSGFHWSISAESNAFMTVVLTAVSMSRSYAWRRTFNNFHVQSNQQAKDSAAVNVYLQEKKKRDYVNPEVAKDFEEDDYTKHHHTQFDVTQLPLTNSVRSAIQSHRVNYPDEAMYLNKLWKDVEDPVEWFQTSNKGLHLRKPIDLLVLYAYRRVPITDFDRADRTMD